MGDVIYIEANSGAVKRVGRCDAYATEFDLEAEEYVPLPKVCFLSLEGQYTVTSYLRKVLMASDTRAVLHPELACGSWLTV